MEPTGWKLCSLGYYILLKYTILRSLSRWFLRGQHNWFSARDGDATEVLFESMYALFVDKTSSIVYANFVQSHISQRVPSFQASKICVFYQERTYIPDARYFDTNPTRWLLLIIWSAMTWTNFDRASGNHKSKLERWTLLLQVRKEQCTPRGDRGTRHLWKTAIASSSNFAQAYKASNRAGFRSKSSKRGAWSVIHKKDMKSRPRTSTKRLTVPGQW